MKLPLSWLADYVHVPPSWDARELGRRLTAAGFEIEGHSDAAPAFHGVVVAKIISAERHPQADKLQVCRVSISAADTAGALQIVCGAANARAGLITALAQVGAELPGGARIKAAKLRGVESAGMLCSARELGLAEVSDGIVELPADTVLGTDLRRALALDDQILEINVTPNRGDAMSVLGIAREVAALAGAALKSPPRQPVTPQAALAVSEPKLAPGAGCVRFACRLLQGVDNTRPTPLWLRERLRRAGLRSISPVVDVTNYVMLELGQPMHAYDRAQLQGGLAARHAHEGEKLTLLFENREITLAEDVLVIADEAGAVGLAGIMGGARTAISAASRDIVLEVAWFNPDVIAGRARRYGLVTDASQRFERGVDWQGQERALERASELILQIAGGVAGEMVLTELPEELPQRPAVTLRPARLTQLLGIEVPAAEVEQRLTHLGLGVSREADRWSVAPPSWRFDIAIEADLIEEVARIGGLDAIPERDAAIAVMGTSLPSHHLSDTTVMRALAARGYQEVITFGFVDPKLQRTLLGEGNEIELANPISADLAVMRRSLWPGLISAARENLRRRAPRARLFEVAHRFVIERGVTREQKVLAALAIGARWPEQWGSAAQQVDFFDLKGDLQSLMALGGAAAEFTFETGSHPALHPGRTARILRGEREVGLIGELHPTLLRALDLTYAPILFEVDFEATFRANLAQFQPISRQPQIRRDLAVTVPESLAFARLRERVSVAAGSLLKHLSVFDVYQGQGVEPGRKSIALGLILQDFNRTLTDEDADRVVTTVLHDLHVNLGAKIRE